MRISNPIAKKPYPKSYITDPRYLNCIDFDIVKFDMNEEDDIADHYLKSAIMPFIMNSALSNTSQDPFITRLKKGVGVKVIVIDGFLSEGNSDKNVWMQQLEKMYPENSWYYLHWGARNIKHIFSNIAINGIAASTAPMGGVAVGLIGYFTRGSSWYKALKNTEAAGDFLANRLSKKTGEFILCGHSLGARVIFHTLKKLEKNKEFLIKDVHLLGGAIGNSKDNWKTAKNAVKSKIYNYKSDNDAVLKYLYKFATIFKSEPVGCSNIDVEGVKNIDVSKIVKGHMKYKENFYASYNVHKRS